HFQSEIWARTGVPWYAEGAQISMVNLRTGTTKELTHDSFNSWRPTWSPDGRFLAFISDRDGSRQAGLWLWDVGADTIKKVSDARLRTDEIVWSPDSKTIFAGTIPQNWNLEDYVARVQSREEYVDRKRDASVDLYEANFISPDQTLASRSNAWN